MTLHLSGKEIKYLINLTEREPVCSSLYKGLLNKLKKSLKPIKISSRKGKGRNLQQQVCKDIARIFNVEYNQQDDNCLIHSREMGQQGKDIILRGIIQERLPISIECKSTEKLNLYKAIEQAKSNMSEDDKAWLVVHKKKNSKPIAIMDWEYFLYG